jgi:hypothetical protein
MKESSMEPTNNHKKSDENSKTNENSSSEVEALLNKLRKTGTTAILTMNKKAQITMSNWAYNLVDQYDATLKNNPVKLKDTAELVLVQRELEDSGFKLSYNLSIKGCASRADFNGFFKA